MDRNEKLAAARKKLKKFQARNSSQVENKTTNLSVEPAVNGALTPFSVTPPMSSSSSPSHSKRAKLSSMEELRGISQEISSLLSENAFSGRKNDPQAPPIPTLISPHLPSDSGSTTPKSLSSSSIDLSAKLSSFMPATSSDPLPTLSLAAPRLVGPSEELANRHLHTHPSASVPSIPDSYIQVASNSSRAPPTVSSSLSNGTLDALSRVDVPLPSLNRTEALLTSSSTEQLGKEGTRHGQSIEHPGPLEVHKRETVEVSYLAHQNHLQLAERELESKVQVHAQTIDILVGEKSALQLELSSLRSQLNNKTRECSDVRSHLKATRQKLEEIERDKLLLSDKLLRKERSRTETHSEVSKLRDAVDRLRASLEDQQQENTELISKITSQAAEITNLRNSNTDLQSKLNMAELLTQQLSGDPSHDATPTSGHSTALAEELSEVKGEVEQLKSTVQRVTSDRDQAYSDLSAFRDAMLQQQEDNARKLVELQSQFSESTVQISSLTGELQEMKREKESLVQKLSSEHAQFEHSNSVVMAAVQEERDNLHKELQQQVQNNAQLTKMNSEQENRVIELEMELSRLKEQTVDQRSLLTTIAQDKETLSRAVSQNKELKANIAELQDAFVHLSHQNMELASELETKKNHLFQMKSLSILTPQVPLETEHAQINSTIQQATPVPQQTTPTLQQTTPTSQQPTPLPASESITLPQANEEEMNRSVSEMEETESDRDGLAKEHQDLEVLLSEKASLLDQLHELQTAHSQLADEHHGLLEQFSQVKHELELSIMAQEKDETDFIGEELHIDIDNLSQEQLTSLQNNFNALQQRFVALMAEKAEIIDQFQEQEHTIMQLASETETIGEYITLYQTQRKALKVKFQEKEEFIRQLLVDKETIQAKLHELQQLVKQSLLEKAQARLPKIGPHNRHVTEALPPTSQTSTPSHPHSPTDVPVHLRPYSHSKPSSPQPPVSPSGAALDLMNIHEDDDDDSPVTTATAEQIMQLLDQLDSGSHTGVAVVVPCQCCTGEVISV